MKTVIYFIDVGISRRWMSLHTKNGIVVKISHDFLKKFLNEKIDFVYEQVRKYPKVFLWISPEEEYRKKEKIRTKKKNELSIREG